MEHLDSIDPAVAALFEAKARRRLQLAQISFPEKVAAVVRLQQMAAPILRARGKAVQPWRITGDTN